MMKIEHFQFDVVDVDVVDDVVDVFYYIFLYVQDNTQLQTVIQDIIDNWHKSRPKIDETKKEVIDVDTKLAKLLENNCIATTVQRHQYTDEELRIRQQILAQYSQVELDDGEDDNDAGPIAAGSSGSSSTNTTTANATNVSNVEKNDPLMAKNTNASDVAQLAKERREQAKLDSKAKKDKDKEDR